MNKAYYHQLVGNKTQVEQRFGEELVWEELADYKMSRVKFEMGDVNLFDETDWSTMSEFVVDNLPKFELAFKPEIDNLKINKMVFVR